MIFWILGCSNFSPFSGGIRQSKRMTKTESEEVKVNSKEPLIIGWLQNKPKA
jgi:hypothetical protein